MRTRFIQSVLLGIATLAAFPAGAGATVINTGDSYNFYSVLGGEHVDMFGGSVNLFDLVNGTVSMHGGFLGGLNTAGGPDNASISIYGGTIANNADFGGYPHNEVFMYVQSASFNGSPITLIPNQFVPLPSTATGFITGVLGDNSSFSIFVNDSGSRPTFGFSAPVPEPTSAGLVAIGSLALLSRRKTKPTTK